MHSSEQRSDTASRRSFLQGGIAAGVATIGLGLIGEHSARGDNNNEAHSPGDIAILHFLAAVELVEDDLWTQYSHLANRNPGFSRALRNIDPSLVRYNADIQRDEASHASFINGYLRSIGQRSTNLDKFRTLRMPQVTGADQQGIWRISQALRLTRVGISSIGRLITQISATRPGSL